MAIKRFILETAFSLRQEWRITTYNNIPIDRPVFIVGLQGGGLTLVSRIIRRNKKVVYQQGNSRFWVRGDEMQNDLARKLPESMRLFHSKPFGDSDFLRGGWVYGTENYINHFKKNNSELTDQDAEQFRKVIRDCIARYAHDPMRARFLDKSQTYGLKIPYIEEIFKDTTPYFIVITRNPHVIITKSVERPALSNLNISKHECFDLAVQHYKNCMTEMALKGRDRENVMFMKFESFLDSPVESVQKICQFTGLIYDPDMMPAPHHNIKGKWYPIEPNRNSKWLFRITQEQCDKINRSLGDLIEAFGYKQMEKPLEKI